MWVADASALMWVSTQQTATQQTAIQQMPHSRCQVHRYMVGATSYIRHHRRTLLPMQITFWISVTPTTQTCTPQHTNTSRPQHQHTDPSRLRFVGPLRIPASGILVKWRSQSMEYMGSMESKSSIVREQSVKHKIEFTRERVETTNSSNISTRPRSIGEVLGGSCIGPCLSGRCTHNEVHDFIIVLAKIVICPWCLWCLMCGYPKFSVVSAV